MNLSFQLCLTLKDLLFHLFQFSFTPKSPGILLYLIFTNKTNFICQLIKSGITFKPSSQLTLPYRYHGLAQCIQMRCRHLIPMTVYGNLCFPELNIRLRFSRIATSFMSMPEASVHHYSDTILRQNNIRTSWQFLIMQTKTESTSMQPLPDQNFRFGVLATDTGHIMVALD